MSYASQPRPLPSFAEARRIVEDYGRNLAASKAEFMPLLDAVGLALAEDLKADRDFPPFPRSTRDGYAVRSADLSAPPARLRCIGSIKAGASPEDSAVAVGSEQAVEIMTGAAVPTGADSVVMVEYTRCDGDEITIERATRAGENVVPAAAEARQGDVMVARGTRITYATVAVAAAIGRLDIAVHRRPQVAILATGDELVDANLPPGPSEIRNSNSYSLAAQVHHAGGEPLILPIARDNDEDLGVLIRKGLESDLLLLSGGVSMGKYDLVEEVLASLGATFFFTGALIQPGKPVVFGEVKQGERTVPFFGLPGNPVSTMVTFQLFVHPILDGLGAAQIEPLHFVQASLKSGFTTKTGLTRFLPGALSGDHLRPEVELVRWQGSGDLMAVAQSNCYIVVPPDRERFEVGEIATLLLF